MRIPVVDLILLVDLVIASVVGWHARKVGRRSPAFDFVIAFFIPVVGPLMYISSIRMGLVPGKELAVDPLDIPRGEPQEKRVSEPSPTLMSELTAEVRKLRADLAEAHAEIERLKGG